MTTQAKEVELYLVPGFMGFDAIARLHYFEGVEAFLRDRLRARNIDLRVVVTETVPAGALAKRAAKLASELARHHRPTCDSVHLLGHSTGGLDIRLLLSPGGAFDVGRDVRESLGSDDSIAKYEHALASTRSASFLATPHYGTPLADLLLAINFDRLLHELSDAAERRFSREGIETVIRVGGLLSRALRRIHLEPKFFRWIGESVLERPPSEVTAYLRSLGEDLGALRNLTQESASLFNAAVEVRDTVDYVSFCTGTNEPRGPIDTNDPFVAFNTRIFRTLWSVVAKRNVAYPYAPDRERAALVARYESDVANGSDVGELDLSNRSNDGLVPTFSQAFGRVGGVFASDHLDCVGNYRHGRTAGFIRSGANFDPARFTLLWSRVADVIARSV